MQRFNPVANYHTGGSSYGDMSEDTTGDYVRFEDAKDLLDTIKACLVSAGGSEDEGVLERQVYMAGNKPSEFIAAQLHDFESDRRQRILLAELLPRLIRKLPMDGYAIFVAACGESPGGCWCGVHQSETCGRADTPVVKDRNMTENDQLRSALKSVLEAAYLPCDQTIQCNACGAAWWNQAEDIDENWHADGCPVFAAAVLLGQSVDVRREPAPKSINPWGMTDGILVWQATAKAVREEIERLRKPPC